MTIIGLVLLCLLGLYIAIAGVVVWGCLGDGETTPVGCSRFGVDLEDQHTLLWIWAPHFKDCISDWMTDVSEWMHETLNIAGVIVVSVFLLLAFIGFLIEWLIAMVCQIPFVLIFLVGELVVRAGKFLFCKK